ncbi:MAG: efflux RND transporter periplasmic adaptor subunit [Rhodocyclaceae bacterium]|nr:efflux RND transporter periplasmic adaptor subunit [Rhodocyclaceae bacterium]
MTRKRAAAIATILMVSVAAIWFYARPEIFAPKKEKAAAPPVPVVVAKASLQDVSVQLEITGRTEAYETVTLKSRVDGQVKTVRFSEGQHVGQGDVLLQLDPADFQAKLNQALANQAKTNAQWQKARADVERYIALRAKGFVSDEKVAELSTAAAAAESSASADSAAAELARLQLSYATIKAPISGIVGAKLVFPGAAVKANDTTLAVVNRVKPLYVSFNVPEKYLPKLQAALHTGKKTMAAEIALPGGSELLAAQVRFIDNGVDASTGTILLKAVMANEQEKLTSGQFVTVSLVLDQLKNAVVIPAEAIQQGAGGSFVFVAKTDDTVEIRKVKIGNLQKTQAVIAEGLSAEEMVVIEGQLRLTAAARIKPVDGGKKPN